MRTAQFFTGGVFHVYTRGVDRRRVFLRFAHYGRCIKTIRSILLTGSATERSIKNQGLALNKKVRLFAYCLMPNHYHLLIQQIEDGGITEFMHKLDTSYTMFFNMNNRRSGRLFESTFKAKLIDSDDLCLHVSRYIHLNPVVAKLVEKPEYWRWSSYREYTDIETKHPLCDLAFIQSFYTSAQSYQSFVMDQIAYANLLHDIQEVKDEDSLFL